MDRIWPLYMGERCTFSRNDAMSFGRGPGDVARDLRIVMGDALGAETKGGGSASPGWIWNFDQSMVRPSRRGGVPVEAGIRGGQVFSTIRRGGRRRVRRERPAGYCCSPQWMVVEEGSGVMMTAGAPTVRPSRKGDSEECRGR